MRFDLEACYFTNANNDICNQNGFDLKLKQSNILRTWVILLFNTKET